MGERWMTRYRSPLTMWTSVAAVVLVTQNLAAHLGPSARPAHRLADWRGWFDGLLQYDGFRYVQIATHGYRYRPGEEPTVAWFPGYPLVIRAVHLLVPDAARAGALISLVAGLAVALLFWRWSEARVPSLSARRLGLAVLLLYPFGYYLYGVVYSDSLFVSLVIGAFLLTEDGRPLAGGLVGALATATRPFGLALVLGLLVLGLERGEVLQVQDGARGLMARFSVPLRLEPRRLRSRHLAGLVALAGIGSYMAYTAVRWDDPLLFLHAQRHWSQGPLAGWDQWTKIGLIDRVLSLDGIAFVAKGLAQGLVVLAVALSVPFVGRRYAWGYAVFVAALVLMAWSGSRDLLGTGRYMLAAFPTAALLGEWLARHKRAAVAYLPASFVAIGSLTVLFARGVYLT